MIVRSRDANGAHVWTAVALLQQLFGDAFASDFGVRLWDGTRIPGREGERFTLRVETPHALRSFVSPPLSLGPGRAFADGLIDCDGDLVAAVDRLQDALTGARASRLVALAQLALHLPAPPRAHGGRRAHLRGVPHSRERDAAAIAFHYDQPLGFYRAFLDERLVYSCAYFDDGVASLASAQLAKLDHILRKVRLAAGERFLDIGCGWGALVIRAAQTYGAEALGITLSRPQYEEANRRIAALGLEGRARVELLDYRDLRDATFDKIASVGMAEHVGRERLAAYFAAATRALRPGGLFLNHAIADQSPQRQGYRVDGFIAHDVFPDGDLLPLDETIGAAERAGLETRDVENLREHYARTLRAWLANLERHREAATAVTDDRTYRVWRLYIAGSAQGFERGRMGIFQTLFAKPAENGRVPLPPTRRDLYR